MLRLLIVIAIMCTSAYFAEKHKNWSLVLTSVIVVAYTLYVGLRTSYNDTPAYIKSFNGAISLQSFLANPDRMNVLHNPLFYGFNSWMRGITDNYHHFFMVVAFFDSALLVRFLKKYSFGHFAFTILVFWGYGLGMFGAAAMKQITAMAVLTLSIDALKNRRWILYILIVLVAGLIHTYAIMFLVLPLFIAPPWNWRTLLLLALTVVVIFTFNTTISTVLDYVDELGRSVSEAEVFDGVSMNVFRVLVFAIVPVMLFVFRGRLVPQMDKTQYVFANMAIIAFMFALLGGVQGANMFGRLATFFMLGDICLLGWILNELFEEQSKRFITTIAVVLFIVFIIYDNKTIDNYGGYASISLFDYLSGVH